MLLGCHELTVVIFVLRSYYCILFVAPTIHNRILNSILGTIGISRRVLHHFMPVKDSNNSQETRVRTNYLAPSLHGPPTGRTYDCPLRNVLFDDVGFLEVWVGVLRHPHGVLKEEPHRPECHQKPACPESSRSYKNCSSLAFKCTTLNSQPQTLHTQSGNGPSLEPRCCEASRLESSRQPGMNGFKSEFRLQAVANFKLQVQNLGFRVWGFEFRI